MSNLNGVNIEKVGALVEAVKANPELGKVRFHAESEWKRGTKTEVKIGELYANGQNIARPDRDFTVVVDEPADLGGQDEAPNPVEVMAAGLCGCITAGMATNGALFGTEFEGITIDMDVLFDVNGVFGLDDDIPNGALEIKYTVRAKSSADQESIDKVMDIINKKSPLKNTLEFPLKIVPELIIES